MPLAASTARLEARISHIVLDLLARDDQGRRYNIEMQVRRYRAWSARSAYYLARTLAEQLESGHDYHQLKPAIGIHLLDFDLFTQPNPSTSSKPSGASKCATAASPPCNWATNYN